MQYQLPGHTLSTPNSHTDSAAHLTIKFVSHNTGPRTLYYDFDIRPTALVYADAIFEIGDQKFHPSRVPDDLVWNRTIARSHETDGALLSSRSFTPLLSQTSIRQ